MRKFIPVFIICAFLIISIPRLLSLDAHWNSDEARWLQRSENFMSAVKQAKFSDTLIAYHPGVTTTWIAGLRTFFVDAAIDVQNPHICSVVYRCSSSIWNWSMWYFVIQSVWQMGSSNKRSIFGVFAVFSGTNAKGSHGCLSSNVRIINRPVIAPVL